VQEIPVLPNAPQQRQALAQPLPLRARLVPPRRRPVQVEAPHQQRDLLPPPPLQQARQQQQPVRMRQRAVQQQLELPRHLTLQALWVLSRPQGRGPQVRIYLSASVA
jgi:hypothetical protein